MDTRQIEERFIDLIDGSADPAECAELEARIAADPELTRIFREYRQIVETENAIRSEAYALDRRFVGSVMRAIEEHEVGFLRRLYMQYRSGISLMRPLLATAAILTVVIAVQLRSGETAIAPQRDREESGAKQDHAAASAVNPLHDIEQHFRTVEEFKKEPDRSDTETAPRPPAAVGGRLSEPAKRKNGAGIPFGQIAEDRLQEAPATAAQPGALSRGIYADEAYMDLSAEGARRKLFGSAPRYNHVGENPRIAVAQEAVSTFSVDVDTASYSNVRRMLDFGQLPPPEAVRIEEFINYFDYDYPVQHEKPFVLHYEIAPAPLEPDRLLLKLGVKSRDAQRSDKPWNLVFLIDVSGSMDSEDKLALVKRGLSLLVKNMRPADRVAIVTYAGESGIALEPTLGSERATILAAIDRLGAGGSTNGSGGINSAYALAEKHKVSGAVNRVVLATDGDFNVGTTSQQELIRLIEEKRRGGVTLTTLGFGSDNINDGMLEQLADKGNGNYFYIDSFQEAQKVLEHNLTANMEVVAKDVKLQIEFNPQHVAYYRLIGYDNRVLQKEDFNNDKIDAGEIGSGHTVTAIYEVILKDSAAATALLTASRYGQPTASPVGPKSDETMSPELKAELAFLKVRFKAPESDRSELFEFPLSKAEIRSNPAQASDDFRFAAAVSYFAAILRNSQFAGQYSLDQVLTLAKGARGKDEGGQRAEFIKLIDTARSLKRS